MAYSDRMISPLVTTEIGSALDAMDVVVSRQDS
jgi:hypothetical protein